MSEFSTKCLEHANTINPTMPQNRDKKNQFTELRPFREANTAVAIEIPNANRIQKQPTISSMVANFNEFSTTAIGEV